MSLTIFYPEASTQYSQVIFRRRVDKIIVSIFDARGEALPGFKFPVLHRHFDLVKLSELFPDDFARQALLIAFLIEFAERTNGTIVRFPDRAIMVAERGFLLLGAPDRLVTDEDAGPFFA